MHGILPAEEGHPGGKGTLLVKDNATRFGLVSILLHWSVAIAVITLLAIGFLFVEPLPRGPVRSHYLHIHMSIGVLAAPLIIARIGWRLRNGKPKAPPQHPIFAFLANSVWRLLLIALVAMLISGPTIVWLHNRPLDFFGLFEIPSPFPPADHRGGVDRLFAGVHATVAWLILGFIGLHVAGALKHLLIDRDNLLSRMVWPVVRDDPTKFI